MDETDFALLIDKFKSRFVVTPSCWIWNGAEGHNGYGIMRIQSSPDVFVRAHRFSYEYFKGPIPEGMLILHECDNRACVNPKHLIVGTQKQNIQDMVKRHGHYKTLRKLNEL